MIVSVIVPVYNTSRYLPQCITSILSQSYSQFELILVNDGSTDDSLNLCEKYSKKDARIIIIDKVNEGVDKARFCGLEISKGDYVTFIDSDDWLCDKDILKKMVATAEETSADYVEMGMQRVMDRHGWIKRPSVSPVLGFIKQPELFEKYYISFFGINKLFVNMAGKMYRKSVLDAADLVPSGFVMGEDLAFNLKLFPYLKRIYIMDNIGYSYRFGGMTSRYNPRLYPDLKKLYLLKEQLIEKYNYDKASNYIKFEIKNVLKSDICQQIIYKVGTKEEVISNISDELSDPVWDRAMQIDGHPNYFKDPFVAAIRDKDAEKVYKLCEEKVRKERWERLAKRIASTILTHI